MSADEAYAKWHKRKRDNQERDQEEHVEIAHQEEEWREEKCQKHHEQNHLSQQKHHKKVKGQEQKASLQDESKLKLPVSEMFTIKAFNS